MRRSKLIIVTQEKRNILNYYGVLKDFDYTDVMCIRSVDIHDVNNLLSDYNVYEEIMIVLDNTGSVNILDNDCAKDIIDYSYYIENVKVYSLEFKKPLWSTKYNQYKILSHVPYLLCSV